MKTTKMLLTLVTVPPLLGIAATTASAQTSREYCQREVAEGDLHDQERCFRIGGPVTTTDPSDGSLGSSSAPPPPSAPPSDTPR